MLENDVQSVMALAMSEIGSKIGMGVMELMMCEMCEPLRDVSDELSMVLEMGVMVLEKGAMGEPLRGVNDELLMALEMGVE
jgi:hypothetical protein